MSVSSISISISPLTIFGATNSMVIPLTGFQFPLIASTHNFFLSGGYSGSSFCFSLPRVSFCCISSSTSLFFCILLSSLVLSESPTSMFSFNSTYLFSPVTLLGFSDDKGTIRCDNPLPRVIFFFHF